jgi:hypothetical protein
MGKPADTPLPLPHTGPFLLFPAIVLSTKTPSDESYIHGEERGSGIWLWDFDKNLPAG